MTYPDPPIILDVDPSGYITGLGQAEKATDSFGSTARTAAIALGPMQKALQGITPTRAMMAGVVGLTAVAGKQEQQLSTLRATAKTTGASYEGLVKQTAKLAKEFPVTNTGARELLTTMSKMGIATKGQEKTVGDLAKTYVRLSGATGENAAGLAAGMTQLNRATNVGQSPERVAKLADSLTTVSAESGASATGILQFSKAIAPMADASGIGQTKIMGISAAFSKMGEDGFVASNAFSKMLGDMNRSVREGSPEMAKYAQIVGTSADEFERLFKADPTEAITQVTEAIGRAGEDGPRMLEQLGLEGVRTQRALTQLSQGGGLREAVSTSVGAYGSGSTKEAAEASFGGLADSATRLATVLEQAAEAVGTPFLGAVTAVTDIMATGVGLATSAGETVSAMPMGALKIPGVDDLGDLFSKLAYAGLPLLAAFKMVPTIVTALGLSQLATSGPLKGFLGGVARNNDGFIGRVAGRFGGDAYNRVVDSGQRPGSARMAPINERMAGYGATTGAALPGRGAPGTGPGLLRQAYGGLGLLGGMYVRTLSEGARLSRRSFQNRGDSTLAPWGAASRDFQAGVKDLRAQRDAGTIDTRQFRAEVAKLAQTAAGGARPLSILTRGIATMTAQAAISAPVVGARAVARGTGLVRSAVGTGVMAMGGLVGLGITAGMAGLAAKSKSDEEDRTRREAARNSTSFIDDYRVAMGKATEATSTFAGAMAAASKSNVTRDMTLAQAMEVTDEDERRAASADKKERVKNYGGLGVDAAARRISLELSGQEVAPDEIQRIQQDLLMSNYSRTQVEEIMAQTSPQGVTDDSSSLVRGRVGDIAEMPDADKWYGWMDVIGGLSNASGADDTSFTIDNLSKDQQKAANELVKGIITRADKASEDYTPAFGQAQELSNIDAAISEAFKSGNNDLAEQLQKSYAEQSGVEGFDMISGAEIAREFGGSFTKALADADKGYRQGTYDPTMEAIANGDAAPVRSQGWVTDRLTEENSPLAELFSATGSGQANGLIRQLMGDPESPQLQQQALQATLAQQREAGTSFVELARQATEAANELGELDDATIAFLGALRQAAEQQIGAQAPFRSASATRQDRATLAASDARLTANTRDARATQQAGVARLVEIREEAANEAKQRLLAYREQMIQRQRMIEDYERQRDWTIKDYNLGIERAEEQHAIVLTRTERNHLRGRERMTDDFHRGERIATRDFNKQMARMAEDGARAMYDPYQRIQVQPIWDGKNLIGNLAEQNQAIADQLGNLGKLRAAGGSNSLITMLGLNDPKNAQQLAQIVSDVSTDPSVIRELEASAQQRMKLGGQLTEDPANVGMTRAREDFAQSMKDNSEQFDIAMDRAAQDYETGLADMSADHTRAMTLAAEDHQRMLDRMATQQTTTLERMAADVKRADEEIVTDLAGLTEMMGQMVNGQVVDFRNRTQSQMQGTLDDVKAFMGEYEALIANAGAALPAAPRAYTGASNAGASGPVGTSTDRRVVSTATTARAPVYGPYTPRTTTNLGSGMGTVPFGSLYGVKPFAVGGVVTAPTMALIGEAGSDEAVIPLNSQGISALATALKQFVSPDDARALRASGGTSITTYDHSVHHSDHSTRFEGPITVQAQDPNEMARKLAAKKRQANLTAPPQRR